MSESGFGGGLSRLQPVRRLSREEWDLLGFQGPLVLTIREHRFLLGSWRRSRSYVVLRGNEPVWGGTRAELARLGIDVDQAP